VSQESDATARWLIVYDKDSAVAGSEDLVVRSKAVVEAVVTLEAELSSPGGRCPMLASSRAA
jgi:hypothetical protein